ncbi:MAG: hypothetical protein FWC78_04890 [Defluviitaleaceae bacterium]|nr:hypothetical protein [Defluviitaleaceae bacterium]
MFELSIILLVVGIAALVLEIIMPGFDGFICGIVGVLALIASAVLAIIYVPGGFVIVGINISVILLAAGILYTMYKRQRFHGKLFLNDTLAEDLPPLDLSGFLGKEGKAVTILRPQGEADFNGVRVDVTSNGPMIERGAMVKVVETKMNKIVVSLVDGN